jgi:hypothetical protein
MASEERLRLFIAPAHAAQAMFHREMRYIAASWRHPTFFIRQAAYSHLPPLGLVRIPVALKQGWGLPAKPAGISPFHSSKVWVE